MYNERYAMLIIIYACLDCFPCAFLYLFSQGASGEANDKLASQMVFSLRGIMGSPAKMARLRLMAGKADPANPLSKFLMVLCKQPRGSKEVIAGGGQVLWEEHQPGRSSARWSRLEVCCACAARQM